MIPLYCCVKGDTLGLLVGENEQPAGDVGQVVEGVWLVEPTGPLWILACQDSSEHGLTGG